MDERRKKMMDSRPQTIGGGRGGVVVLVSADAEWRAVKDLFPDAAVQASPLGEWFEACLPRLPERLANRPARAAQTAQAVRFFHGGWGKIAAAASAQYVIDHWAPELLANLGTCGGFEGEIERGAILLVERTVVYDIFEQMGDPEAHIAHYTTEIDLSWLDTREAGPVQRALLVSGDRDLKVEDLPGLKARYGAVAGDWESGAIAFVAGRNRTRCLILRGVTDLVGSRGGEAYGNLSFFAESAARIMAELVGMLPGWIRRAGLHD